LNLAAQTRGDRSRNFLTPISLLLQIVPLYSWSCFGENVWLPTSFDTCSTGCKCSCLNKSQLTIIHSWNKTPAAAPVLLKLRLHWKMTIPTPAPAVDYVWLILVYFTSLCSYLLCLSLMWLHSPPSKCYSVTG